MKGTASREVFPSFLLLSSLLPLISSSEIQGTLSYYIAYAQEYAPDCSWQISVNFSFWLYLYLIKCVLRSSSNLWKIIAEFMSSYFPHQQVNQKNTKYMHWCFSPQIWGSVFFGILEVSNMSRSFKGISLKNASFYWASLLMSLHSAPFYLYRALSCCPKGFKHLLFQFRELM